MRTRATHHEPMSAEQLRALEHLRSKTHALKRARIETERDIRWKKRLSPGASSAPGDRVDPQAFRDVEPFLAERYPDPAKRVEVHANIWRVMFVRNPTWLPGELRDQPFGFFKCQDADEVRAKVRSYYQAQFNSY